CFYTYGNNPNYGFIYRKPIFSMTESIRMAEDIVAMRMTTPFQSPSDFTGYLHRWNKGYDAKERLANRDPVYKFSSTLGATDLNNAHRYRDVVQQNRRGRILGYLLSPKPMSNELIWDDALPKSIDHKLHGLGGNGWPYQPNESFNIRSIFDLFDPHEIGSRAQFSTGSFRFQSLGIQSSSGKSQATAKLTATRDMFFRVDIFSQQDFVRTCSDPLSGASTLGSLWVTYPEMPGVPPSTWEGHLALRPRQQECPMGDNLVMRAPLSGYEAIPVTSQTNLWPSGPRKLLGPSENPARGKFLNSLRPKPGEAIPSLFPANASEVDTASDLLPGGGIRVSPYHNNFFRASTGAMGVFPPEYENRREALLVMRNAIISDADDALLPVPDYPPGSVFDPGPLVKVLPNFHEGSISFYFKPRFSVAYMASNNHAQTLFYTPFVIKDQETAARLGSLGVIDLDQVRDTFVASMRLVWRPVDDVSPVFTKLDSVYGAGAWPWVQPFDEGGVIVPHQVATGPYLFSDMSGYTAFPGQEGYLMTRYAADPVTNIQFFNQSGMQPNGDLMEGHWGAPRPHAAEGLEVEFLITKQAFGVDTANVGNSVANIGYPTWNGLDGLSPLALGCAYINPVATGLYLMDTCDPAKPDYHTVRKSFILGHPWSLDPATRGRGPLDRNGNHQCLVEPGRWNHIFMAWRNLFDLLNNGSPHKGGCLAVWVNGTFKKVLAGSRYEVAGLFFHQDYYPAYRTGNVTIQGTLADFWYNSMYTTPGYPTHITQVITHPTFHLQNTSTGARDFLALAPMGTDNHTHLMNVAFMRPENGLNNVKKQRLFSHFPLRFYFGHEPVTNRPAMTSNYFVSNMTWGAFMDIQIFDKADPALFATDGGFKANPALPTYDTFSVYASDTTVEPALRVYPGLMAPEMDRVVSVAWSASLPEFHQFWDDQHDAVAGPDALDSQKLFLSTKVGGANESTFQLSQDPTDPSPVYSWKPEEPMQLSNPIDLLLELTFMGPSKVYATPLVHSIEVIYKKKMKAPLRGFSWE
ncbi:MAG: hypothetical protein AB7F75_09800, partial [Planctomycetota bacterium]